MFGLTDVVTPRRVRLALAVAAASLLAQVSPASAAPLEINYGDPNASGHPWAFTCNAFVITGAAEGCFEEDGDWLYAKDRSTDGEQVATYWRVPDADRHGLCISNYPAILGVRAWCNKNFPEGLRIYIQVGKCHHTESRHCLALGDYTNWSGQDSATT